MNPELCIFYCLLVCSLYIAQYFKILMSADLCNVKGVYQTFSSFHFHFFTMSVPSYSHQSCILLNIPFQQVSHVGQMKCSLK